MANRTGLRALALKFDPIARIDLIPNGVDLETFAPVERAWSPPRLLSVGRVIYQKGLDLAARALANLKDMDWELIPAAERRRALGGAARASAAAHYSWTGAAGLQYGRLLTHMLAADWCAGCLAC